MYVNKHMDIGVGVEGFGRHDLHHKTGKHMHTYILV